MTQKNKMTTDEILETIRAYTQAEYFLGQNGQGFVEYFDLKNRITRKIRAKEYKRFLMILSRKSSMDLTTHQLDDLIDEMEAIAITSEITKEVFIRIGHHSNEALYIDNNDSPRTYTEIKKGSWKKVSSSPIPFLASSYQKPIPSPKPVSKQDFLNIFKRYFNLKNDKNLVLILAFILKCFIRECGSCVIFVFQGKQDSGKSSSSEFIKYIIDPTDPLLSVAPKNPDDIIYQANSGYFLGFDNLSYISNELSDFLCSVVYGITHYKRALYTDDDQVRYNIKRDLLFNGIDDLSKRPDLQDRLVQVELEPIRTESRKSKTLLQKEMEADRPYLLHGLYDILSEVLLILPDIQEINLPRMADYARIGIALEKVIGLKEGTFLEVYNQNITERVQNSFWDDELCCLIYATLNKNQNQSSSRSENITEAGDIKGTAMELNQFLFKRAPKGKYSPKNARAFSSYLKRVEPILKLKNIYVEREIRSDRREITIGFKNAHPLRAENLL